MSNTGRLHKLTTAQIASLAAGVGDGETIKELAAVQYSRSLSAMASILQSLPSDRTRKAVRLLDLAKELDGARYEEALKYPHVAVWSDVCLEQLLGASADGSVNSHGQYLDQIAAVVAWQAGVSDFEIDVAISTNGDVVLPGLGRALFSEVFDGRATVRCVEGQLLVATEGEIVHVPDDPHADGDAWEAVRVVHLTSGGLTLRVAIDDIDPYRGYYRSAQLVPPDHHLDEVAFKEWKEVLVDAWDLLVGQHRDHAIGISAGLRVIVPVFHEVLHRHDHAPNGFGAIAVTGFNTHVNIAHALLEQFQRMKLTALQYMYPLHTETYEMRRFLAPWTESPLSLRELFEGYYSLAAMTSFWHNRFLRSDGEERIEAGLNFVRWQTWVEAMRGQLLTSEDLTQAGRDFIANMPEQSSLPSIAVVPSVIRSLARSTGWDQKVCWRLQNLEPEQTDLEPLVAAWLAGMACPTAHPIRVRVRTEGPIVTGRAWRRRLAVSKIAHLQATDSAFEAMSEILDSNVCAGDLHLVNGEINAAIESYSELIAIAPENVEFWAGLAAACVERGDIAALTLGRFPEIVWALHVLIRNRYQESEDPVRLANWTAPLLIHMDDAAFLRVSYR